MEIIWNSLLIAAAVCLVLFLLATAVGAVFFKMVLVREKHPGDPMNKSHVTPEELERWRKAVREGNDCDYLSRRSQSARPAGAR